MSDDIEALPEKERARVRARDRKVRGPRVIVDNAGLKKLALERGRQARERARDRDRPARP